MYFKNKKPPKLVSPNPNFKKKTFQDVIALNSRVKRIAIHTVASNLLIEAGDDDHAYVGAEGFWNKDPSFIIQDNAVCFRPASSHTITFGKMTNIYATYFFTIPEHLAVEVKMIDGGTICILDIKGPLKLDISHKGKIEGHISSLR